MIKLETDRLILRNYTMEDIDDIFEIFVFLRKNSRILVYTRLFSCFLVLQFL